MQPSVSIIMPAYKAERTISTAIESVLLQSVADFELIICDDASPDNTAQVIKRFHDERIILLTNNRNLGAGLSRDKAISQARGKWLTFLDADDAWKPHRLERLLCIAQKHPAAIVFDELMECHDTPVGLQPWRSLRAADTFPGIPNEIREISVASWISARRLATAPLIPFRLIHEYSITHPTLDSGEDIAFRLSLLGRSRATLWYVPEPLYLYRMQAGSLSCQADSTRMLIEALKGSIEEFSWSPTTQDAIHKRIHMAKKREYYMVFFNALMQKYFLTAAKIAIGHPWVTGEFLLRSIKAIPYHFSRLYQGGSWKKKL